MTSLSRRQPGLAVLALGLWVVGYAGTFPALDDGHPGPALFPRLIGGGLVLCGMVLVAAPGGVVDAGGTEWTRGWKAWKGPLRLGTGLLLIGVFPWLNAVLGFLTTAAGLVFVFSLLLGARLGQAAVLSAGSAAAVYLLFSRLLGVPL
jgi:putative tricarboxylic transport membrane protein